MGCFKHNIKYSIYVTAQQLPSLKPLVAFSCLMAMKTSLDGRKPIGNTHKQLLYSGILCDVEYFFCVLIQGYLVNWDVQRKVWDHLFGKEMFKVLIIFAVIALFLCQVQVF